MKVLRKILEIDEEKCDGCGQCVPACAEGAIAIEEGKARLVAERFCDGLGACLGECPNDAIRIIEREAEDFDEEAVEAYLKEKETEPPKMMPQAPCCPSRQVASFATAGAPPSESESAEAASHSALGHWPVQIHLVPPTAPFLKGADLLVTADCVPVAYAAFHRDFLQGKVVLMGCPKFDDVPSYVRKFTDIFGQKPGVRSVTILTMEVPCCSALPMIVKKALADSRRSIPIEEVVISRRGTVLGRSREESEMEVYP
jgi:Pyruvate/2-oxoacid:ferredoxin oxidoreductase delta subunit